jgi:hypothetical protein
MADFRLKTGIAVNLIIIDGQLGRKRWLNVLPNAKSFDLLNTTLERELPKSQLIICIFIHKQNGRAQSISVQIRLLLYVLKSLLIALN